MSAVPVPAASTEEVSTELPSAAGAVPGDFTMGANTTMKGKLGKNAPTPPPVRILGNKPQQSKGTQGVAAAGGNKGATVLEPAMKLKTADPSLELLLKLKAARTSSSSGTSTKSKRLPLTHAPRLTSVQDADGSFCGEKLLQKIEQLWRKFMVTGQELPQLPSGASPPLSSSCSGEIREDLDPTDATAFVVRAFEIFEGKLSADGAARVDGQSQQLLSWFGSDCFWFGPRFLQHAKEYLNKEKADWRTSENLRRIDFLVETYFDSEVRCSLPRSFVDGAVLKEKQKALADKFAASQLESLRRERLWQEDGVFEILNTPPKTPPTSEEVTTSNGEVESPIFIPWDKATAVRWCFGGGGGAFLVRLRLPSGSWKLVIKGCEGEGDVIAHKFAELLTASGCGFSYPATRFLSPGCSEFRKAKSCLLEQGEIAFDEPEHRQRLAAQFSKLENTGCPLMVMEFVAGEPLQNTDDEGRRFDASSAFCSGSPATNISARGAAGSLPFDARLLPSSSNLVRALGRMAAFDVLINNWDRFPLLPSWPSRGNLGNVLVRMKPTDEVSVPEPEATSIDHAFQLLCEPQRRADYFREVRRFAEEASALSMPEEGFSSRKRLRAAISSQVLMEVERDTGETPPPPGGSGGSCGSSSKSTQGVFLTDAACDAFFSGVQEVFQAGGSAERAGGLRFLRPDIGGPVLSETEKSKRDAWVQGIKRHFVDGVGGCGPVEGEQNNYDKNFKGTPAARGTTGDGGSGQGASKHQHGERIEASVSFIGDCLGVVASAESCEEVVESTLDKKLVFPKNKFFSTLQ